MAGPTCSVCGLDKSTVGDLEQVHSNVLKNGNMTKVSILACKYCKENLLEVYDENVKEPSD